MYVELRRILEKFMERTAAVITAIYRFIKRLRNYLCQNAYLRLIKYSMHSVIVPSCGTNLSSITQVVRENYVRL